MTKVITFIIFLFGSVCTYSEFEFNQKVEVLARSFPIGGFSKFSMEAITPIWGKKNHPKDISYGFLGGQLDYRTSALVNYLSGKLFLYPIPILGLFFGQESGIKQLKKIDTFDCNKQLCDGKMERSFMGLRLALAYQNFFFVTENKWSNINPDKDSLPFVDEMTSLLGNPGQDKSFISLNTLGYNLSEEKKFGAIYISNEMKLRSARSQMFNLFFQQSWDRHTLISSIGVFQTRETQDVGTLLFLYRWSTPSSFRLF